MNITLSLLKKRIKPFKILLILSILKQLIPLQPQALMLVSINHLLMKN